MNTSTKMVINDPSIDALDSAREKFFLENGAVSFADIFRKNQEG
jgi:hypothetical protein